MKVWRLRGAVGREMSGRMKVSKEAGTRSQEWGGGGVGVLGAQRVLKNRNGLHCKSPLHWLGGD